MNVYLKTDGRVFESSDDYQPGDVAWFEEDILLVVAIRGGQAEAVEHPDAAKMMEAALTFGPKGPDRVNHGLAEAYRIHGRASWQRALAACPHPEDDVAPLSGDAWMCVGCGQDVEAPPAVQSTATDAAIDATVTKAPNTAPDECCYASVMTGVQHDGDCSKRKALEADLSNPETAAGAAALLDIMGPPPEIQSPITDAAIDAAVAEAK